jgi:hypothetical protein
VQRGNDRRRRQHGNPQTRAGQKEQDEWDQARADDGSLYSWRWPVPAAGGGASLHDPRRRQELRLFRDAGEVRKFTTSSSEIREHSFFGDFCGRYLTVGTDML